MSASKLSKPNLIYKDSFLEALQEYHEEDRYTFLNLNELNANFEDFITSVNEEGQHLHKPFPDWAEPVQETAIWLVKGPEYYGSVTIRHRLNWHLEKWGGHINFIIRPSMRGKGFGKKILQKAMPAIGHLGIDRALLTPAPDNEPAKRIIEFCSGEFENESPETEQFPARLHYWLDCT